MMKLRGDPHHPFQDFDSPRFVVPVLISFVVPIFSDYPQAAEIIIRKYGRWESASILVAVRSCLVAGSLDPHHPFQDFDSPCFVVPVLISFVVPIFSDGPQAAEIVNRKCILDPHHPFQDFDSPSFVVPVLISFLVPIFSDYPQAAKIIVRKYGRWESASILVAVHSCLVAGSLCLDLKFYRDPHHPFPDFDSPCFVVPVLISFWFLYLLIVLKLPRSSLENVFYGRWESASILVAVRSCLVAGSLCPGLEFYRDPHHPFQDFESPCFEVPVLISFWFLYFLIVLKLPRSWLENVFGKAVDLDLNFMINFSKSGGNRDIP
ncbi:uncharacterized protein G2W53_032840 [Senna tora]|uniref:Uncharacterized protein n=1 Tax=Senna tora TaxID=362788 RepID=A0A834WC80_9FABA|nr:uncharacterized protein G2W53_032840 [Senna tora]